MAVRIRLARFGRKKKPFYRIVVANSEARRDGKFLEIVGTYDPNMDPEAVTLYHDKIKLWLDRGAQPTDTVKSLLSRHSEPAPVAE